MCGVVVGVVEEQGRLAYIPTIAQWMWLLLRIAEASLLISWGVCVLCNIKSGL